MPPITAETLPTEAHLALAHTHPDLRGALTMFLELDNRLARIVGATTEPMLGQMRLAWWREQLDAPRSSRPTGDTVLDGIGDHWAGHEAALVKLVDGWEHMLAETLGDAAALAFAAGRGAGFAALAARSDPSTDAKSIEEAGKRWALVDAAMHVPEGAERDLLLSHAEKVKANPRFAAPLRGLAVLDALARRSLKRGGRPLMEGRGASLAATRGAIFGR